MKVVWFLCYILFLFTSCANIQPPSGGDGDTTPPTFIASVSNNTLNFDDNEIVLTFSKYMNRQLVNENLMILPTTKYTHKWNGKRLVLHFDSLQQNTTYSIQIGGNVTDYYGVKSNNISATVFSTGSIIDTGKIVGKFLNVNDIGVAPENYILFVYNLTKDTISYATQKANYKAVINQEGRFNVPALKDGNYRIIAVRDIDKDDVINIIKDTVAIATFDAVVKNGISDTMLLVSFKKKQLDTIDSVDTTGSDSIKVDTTTKDTNYVPPVYQKFSGNIDVNFQYNNEKYILLISTTNKTIYQEMINSDSTFTFPEILSDEYKIMLYYDINGNGEYDAGNLEPFSFAEPFIISSQLLTIKEHWDIEGYVVNE